MKKKQGFIIGIDSGGSNTRIGFKSLKDNSRIINNYPSVHFTTLGADKFSIGISKFINDFLDNNNLSFSDSAGIAIGAAGLRYDEDKKKVKSTLVKKTGIDNILAESDAYISLYDAFGDKDGILLICGTGSVLYAQHNKIIERIGGWGRAFLDPGSGYHMGIMFLREVTKVYDLNDANSSSLSEGLKKNFGITADNLLDKLYKENFNPAVLIPYILKLAEEKNAVAGFILKEAINELLNLLRIYFYKRIFNEKIKTVFGGSILTSRNIFSKQLIEEIIKNFGNKILLSGKKINPLEGAFKLIEKQL